MASAVTAKGLISSTSQGSPIRLPRAHRKAIKGAAVTKPQYL